jgi:hypothetical protein
MGPVGCMVFRRWSIVEIAAFLSVRRLIIPALVVYAKVIMTCSLLMKEAVALGVT